MLKMLLPTTLPRLMETDETPTPAGRSALESAYLEFYRDLV